jgi:hypothetical protein
MNLVPFMLGVGLIFYDRRSIAGWLLAIGSATAFIVGVIASLNFTIRGITAFELITMLVLSFGGLGLFLQSLRSKE